jgi:hypothetical protein
MFGPTKAQNISNQASAKREGEARMRRPGSRPLVWKMVFAVRGIKLAERLRNSHGWNRPQKASVTRVEKLVLILEVERGDG